MGNVYYDFVCLANIYDYLTSENVERKTRVIVEVFNIKSMALEWIKYSRKCSLKISPRGLRTEVLCNFKAFE